jgi:hypothetical protein
MSYELFATCWLAVKTAPAFAKADFASVAKNGRNQLFLIAYLFLTWVNGAETGRLE